MTFFWEGGGGSPTHIKFFTLFSFFAFFSKWTPSCEKYQETKNIPHKISYKNAPHQFVAWNPIQVTYGLPKFLWLNIHTHGARGHFLSSYSTFTYGILLLIKMLTYSQILVPPPLLHCEIWGKTLLLLWHPITSAPMTQISWKFVKCWVIMLKICGTICESFHLYA